MKSILVTHYFSNTLLLLLFNIDMLGLLINYDNIFGCFLRWITIGWTGNPLEKNITMAFNENIDDFEYTILIAWSLSYIIFLGYYFINSRKDINKWSFFTYNLKYLLINYFNLYLYNLNIILNVNSYRFWSSFFNLIILNSVTFWFPGILFNFIYGDKLYIYRKKFKFLIEEYSLKYKYFTLELILGKLLLGVNIIFSNFYTPLQNYGILLILCVSIIIYYKFNILSNRKNKNYLLYLNFYTLFVTILAIINKYVEATELSYVIYSLIILTYIIILIVNIKIKKNNVFQNNVIQSNVIQSNELFNIEMSELDINEIELN